MQLDTNEVLMTRWLSGANSERTRCNYMKLRVCG